MPALRHLIHEQFRDNCEAPKPQCQLEGLEWLVWCKQIRRKQTHARGETD